MQALMSTKSAQESAQWTWTGPKLARLWERGDLLRDVMTGNSRFPLCLSLKPPSSADITDRFNEVRA
ncbi:MAG: hypothetical protein (DUF3322) [Candidatus Nitrotoga sp. LAW]|nr:MAG: hypothetical protein (DUF3322) [Candidatus Nitrotoga sp. LAW]